MAFDLREMVDDALREFGKNIERFAGADVKRQVLPSAGQPPEAFDVTKTALDYKDALIRLDKLTDKATCNKIMDACGRHCEGVFDQEAHKAKERRQSYSTEEAFLADFQQFDNGTRIERRGNDLVMSFSPGKLFPHLPDLRCACMLLGGLPRGVNASPAACECSRAFTQQRWETILGRPVQVEMGETPIVNGSKECVFIIHLK
jgi:hypothetical protein